MRGSIQLGRSEGERLGECASGGVGQVQITQGLVGHSQITRIYSKHKGKTLEGFDFLF